MYLLYSSYCYADINDLLKTQCTNGALCVRHESLAETSVMTIMSTVGTEHYPSQL